MNPFYFAFVYILKTLSDFFSFLHNFVTGNQLLIIVSVVCFFIGIFAGFLVAWFRYFWRHFLYRG